MSKRKKPLSTYQWGLLDDDDDNPRAHSKRKITGHVEEDNIYGDMEADELEEDEEEETAHIDEQPRQQQQQQQGLAVLNSMPIKGKGRAAEEDVPSVGLHKHYCNHYNRWSNECFTHSQDDSSDDDAEHEPYDTRKRGECFLCAWGNRFHDGVKAKHVNKLFAILDNYGACDNIELAMQLHLYFKEKVYRAEKGMCMLTAQIALEHITGVHSLSAVIFIGESIRAWKETWFCLRDSMFKENNKCDKDTFNSFKESQKMLLMLYKMDPKHMNFNFGKSREDINKLGMPFMMMTEMKQVRDKDKRTRKTKKLLSTDERYNRGIEI